MSIGVIWCPSTSWTPGTERYLKKMAEEAARWLSRRLEAWIVFDSCVIRASIMRPQRKGCRSWFTLGRRISALRIWPAWRTFRRELHKTNLEWLLYCLPSIQNHTDETLALFAGRKLNSFARPARLRCLSLIGIKDSLNKDSKSNELSILKVSRGRRPFETYQYDNIISIDVLAPSFEGLARMPLQSHFDWCQ